MSEKIKKANNMLGLIIISFCCLNADILLPLYNAFVRHLLGYGAPVWSGCMMRLQIRVIEKIHMGATDMIEGMSYIEYGELPRQTCAMSDQEVEIGTTCRVTCPITSLSK